MNEYAVQQLELTSSDRVLEIGFGGGVTLPTLINGAAFVGGIDLSKDLIESARVRFSSAIASGHADFREGAVERPEPMTRWNVIVATRGCDI